MGPGACIYVKQNTALVVILSMTKWFGCFGILWSINPIAYCKLKSSCWFIVYLSIIYINDANTTVICILFPQASCNHLFQSNVHVQPSIGHLVTTNKLKHHSLSWQFMNTSKWVAVPWIHRIHGSTAHLDVPVCLSVIRAAAPSMAEHKTQWCSAHCGWTGDKISVELGHK